MADSAPAAHATEQSAAAPNTPKDAPPPYTSAYPPQSYPPMPQPPYPPAPYPPAAQYPAQAQVVYPPNSGYHTTATVAYVQPGAVTTTFVTDGCPLCRRGRLVERFSFCGIMFAIFFFPIGILCCLAMRIKTCTSCGATFS